MTVLVNRRFLPEPGETLFIRIQRDHEIGYWPIAAELRAYRGSSLLLEVGASGNEMPGARHAGNPELEIVFIRASGFYRFNTILTRFWSTQSGAMMVVDGPKDVEHLQRRREVRLPLRLTTRLKTAGASATTRSDSVQLIDLSAVGARIQSSSMLRAGDIVTIESPTGKDGFTETVHALVLDCARVSCSEAEKTARYEARLQFDDGESVQLPQRIRDEIAAYVFEQQRLSLKIRRLLNDRGGGPTASAKKNRLLTNMLAWMRAPSQRWKL